MLHAVPPMMGEELPASASQHLSANQGQAGLSVPICTTKVVYSNQFCFLTFWLRGGSAAHRATEDADGHGWRPRFYFCQLESERLHPPN